MAASKLNQPRILFWLMVIAISAFLYWLNIEFREGGLLGALQIYGAGLVVFPYFMGVLAGSAHLPNDVGIFIGLIIEVAFLSWLFRFLYKKFRGTIQ